MNLDAQFEITSELSAVVTRADGSVEDLGIISKSPAPEELPVWKRTLAKLRDALPVLIGVASVAYSITHPHHAGAPMLGLVTNVGAQTIANNFLASPTVALSAMKWADCGTGTTAEAVTQTALVSAAGTSRQAGTQSNPSSNQYGLSATISFTSTLAITEMGIFSASTSGSMFDRRVFSAINVGNGDSITFNYTCTVNSGGS